ncbi:MAG: hypothetical protein WD033_06160 [Nitrosopumilaceae archaeon]
MAKKKDSLCFDISSLDQDQKVSFAKSLKKTVDKFNSDLNESEEPKQEEPTKE